MLFAYLTIYFLYLAKFNIFCPYMIVLSWCLEIWHMSLCSADTNFWYLYSTDIIYEYYMHVFIFVWHITWFCTLQFYTYFVFSQSSLLRQDIHRINKVKRNSVVFLNISCLYKPLLLQVILVMVDTASDTILFHKAPGVGGNYS